MGTKRRNRGPQARTRINWEKASWIAGVVSTVLVIVGFGSEWAMKEDTVRVSQVAGAGSTQIGTVFGTVVVSQTPAPPITWRFAASSLR